MDRRVIDSDDSNQGIIRYEDYSLQRASSSGLDV